MAHTYQPNHTNPSRPNPQPASAAPLVYSVLSAQASPANDAHRTVRTQRNTRRGSHSHARRSHPAISVLNARIVSRLLLPCSSLRSSRAASLSAIYELCLFPFTTPLVQSSRRRTHVRVRMRGGDDAGGTLQRIDTSAWRRRGAARASSSSMFRLRDSRFEGGFSSLWSIVHRLCAPLDSILVAAGVAHAHEHVERNL